MTPSIQSSTRTARYNSHSLPVAPAARNPAGSASGGGGRGGERGDVLGWGGTSEVPALGEVAARASEHAAGGLVGDSLGHGAHSEGVGHLDGGGDDGRVVVVGEHVRDEAAVDLDLRQGQSTQVLQR